MKKEKKGSKKRINRCFNCLPSENVESDWGADLVLGNSTSLKSKDIDLRASWMPISDQGLTGSCVGQSLAYTVLKYYFVKNKKIQSNDTIEHDYIWKAAKETDRFTNFPTTMINTAGTSLKTALDLVRKYGCVTSKDYNRLINEREEKFYATASKLKISGYYSLNTAIEMANWLKEKGPIAIGFMVTSNFENSKGTPMMDVDSSPRVGGHAAAIVAYKRLVNTDMFLIKNSWGTIWGDKGYLWVSYQYLKALNYFDAYGVL